ncbi:SPT5 [Candida oxycetoniae]|uniref:Transcription elongation factor SPT5 n=1 Tax=Candida oxycetoniae TaxID=497107 RepID=A0AAI9WXW5_9ASCO|nr:SPT5 [Candida oxycetoniae]KAI3404424.2 SPT5 [Candida oxycetoniae]
MSSTNIKQEFDEELRKAIEDQRNPNKRPREDDDEEEEEEEEEGEGEETSEARDGRNNDREVEGEVEGEEGKRDNGGGDGGNDDEDDDDDEEEEEDEDSMEEDEEVSGRRRKRKRGANQFFDIEAEVDDEEEDDAEEDDEEAEILREQFISDDHVHEDSGPQHEDDRLHRQYDRRRQEEEDQDAEQIAERLKERYKKSHQAYRGESAANGVVSQKLLMPSINDPAIYAIRCTPGKEKEVVRKLYEKKRTLERQRMPLDILTVFQRDSFRGYVYIEAKRPDAIDKALQGMVNIYGRDKLLVSVKEYPDLLKQVKSSDVELKPGVYVRIARGKYKGDLAVVDNLSENGLDVRCKVVPRLDYGRNDEIGPDGKVIKSRIRPPPQRFDAQAAKMFDSLNLQQKGSRSYTYKGDEYVDGYLYKDFKLQYIQTQDVQPSLGELEKFQAGSENEGLDLQKIVSSFKNKSLGESRQSTPFQPGDKVEIRRGEQAKTIGIVVEASLNEIKIRVTNSGDPKFVNQNLTVPATDLRKIFSEGDHVRIVEGKHFDETGLIIKIDGDSVLLVSDQTKEDVKVFANYLVKATDASSTVDKSVDYANSKYDIKDLVELSATTVGVIVKAEKNIFEVLTSDGRLIDVRPSAIASKLNQSRREQIATDKNGFTIKVGDTVKEATGDKGREGAILHIYKNTLFIKSNEIIENLGIFVANRMAVNTVATKDSMVSKSFGPDLTSMNPNIKPADSFALQGLKTRVGGRDKLLYKDVAIRVGSYKGLKGKVSEADDLYARVELHTKSKKVKVLKKDLSVLIRGEAIPYLVFIGGSAEQPGSFSKPFSGGPTMSTPGDRSAWNGGATPAVSAEGAASTWNKGGASAWNAGGGKTPAYGSSGSTWGGSSSWNGGGGGGGAASTWNATGGASAWGNTKSGAGSTWGSTGRGSGSTWGGGGSGNSGNKGNSSWGGAARGNGSAWGGAGNSSTWGGNSGSSNKKGNSSSWGS